MADIREQLTKYLTDAHSIEEQALAQLRTAPKLAGDQQLAEAYERHLTETEGHERTIRKLLDDRGAKPSRTKDVVMAVGGKGFLLFARLQPDTPGKLHAHALSYEALEVSSYELLRRVAERADESAVVDAARRIADEERGMMERLEGSFDLAVEASLKELEPDDIHEQLRKYLADAHAIEQQAAQLLERGPKLAADPKLADVYAAHLVETREHGERIQERLGALGGQASSLKDAAMRLGALNWAAFFRGHPDTPGKLAAFAYAFEYLEIGAYEQLRRVANRTGNTETISVVAGILAEERAAARSLAGAFDEAVTASLKSVGIAAG
jgi:ferritin-like metal-binding protein YciE